MVDGDPLGEVFNVKAFHRCQVVQFLKHQLIPADTSSDAFLQEEKEEENPTELDESSQPPPPKKKRMIWLYSCIFFWYWSLLVEYTMRKKPWLTFIPLLSLRREEEEEELVSKIIYYLSADTICNMPLTPLCWLLFGARLGCSFNCQWFSISSLKLSSAALLYSHYNSQ